MGYLESIVETSKPLARRVAAAATVAIIVASAMACGGDNGGGPSPTPNPGTGTIAATFTITASGVSPREATVPIGSRVTFVNNDTATHDMHSDPHPEHGDCPGLDQVGFLSPGQSKTSGNLNTARVCGFHDHGRPDVASLRGTIRVQ